MTGHRAIIIGAGYGGMALANLLGKAGYTVTVFEKNSTPGGRIAALRKDGFTFDIGPSWYLMPEVFEQYYALFGASAKARLDLVRLNPAYKVYFEDDLPLEITGDVATDAAIFEAIEPGAGERLKKYVATSTRIYEIAVKHFLYSNFQHVGDVLKTDIMRHAPKLSGKLLSPLDAYVSKQFTDPRLKRILEYHMVFLGSSPFQAPALYTLMSHLDFASGVFYPRKGMFSLVDDMQLLGKQYDITYRYDAPVTKIIATDGVARGVVLADGSTAGADLVISNADLHFTETQLLTPEYQTYPESYWAKRQPGPAAMVMALGVRGALPQLEHHTLFFADDWRANFKAIYEDMTIPDHPSVYVCNPNKTDPSLAPAGTENLLVLVPLPSGVKLSAHKRAALADRTIQQISTMLGQADLPGRIISRTIYDPGSFGERYNAWEYNAFGGESHVLRQSALFRSANRSRKVQGLYYVGAGTMPGIGLPMCLISAELAYKRITGSKRGGALIHEKGGS
jgi:phytoene desaturase